MEDLKCLLVLRKIAKDNDERIATATAWMVDKDSIVIHDGNAYWVKYIINHRDDDSWEAIRSIYYPGVPFDIQQDEIFDKKWGFVNHGA